MNIEYYTPPIPIELPKPAYAPQPLYGLTAELELAVKFHRPVRFADKKGTHEER